MLLTSLNILVLYATPIIIDTVSLNDVLSILTSLTVSKISSASFLTLFAISLLLSFSFSYMRISIFLEVSQRLNLFRLLRQLADSDW